MENLENPYADSNKIWELIQESKKITLLTHRKPDGDGISACAALELVITKLGKEVETVYPNNPDFEFKHQPKKVLINKHEQVPDLLIACDTADYKRLYYPDDYKNIPLINIDHHASNSIKGICNIVDIKTSSACEVVYNLLSEAGDFIDKSVAKTLLYGILYDSQVFHTQSTFSSTLRIAADLVDKGANLYKLKMELISNKNPNVIKLWKELLGRVQIFEEKNVVLSYIIQEDLQKLKVKLSSLVGFNNFLSGVADNDITLLFYETDRGKTKVSLRSREYDVNELAAKFGGGGHKNAAGILSEKPLKQLMNEMLKEIR